MKVSTVKTVDILSRTLTFAVKKGKLTIDGEHFELTPSGSTDYPAAAGWFKYSANSFINISPTDIKVVAMSGGKKLPVTVSNPDPLPVESKCFFLKVPQQIYRFWR